MEAGSDRFRRFAIQGLLFSGALVALWFFVSFLLAFRGPRIIVPVRPVPPPPPPVTYQWSLISMKGNVACGPDRTVCTVGGAGSLHGRFTPWSRLTGGTFDLDANRGVIRMRATGSELRIESDVPLTVQGNVLSVEGGVTGVWLDWKYWFDTHKSSNPLTASEYALY